MRYYIEEYDGGPEDSYYFDPFKSTDLRWAAEEAADYFFCEHDGWDSTWPLTFVLLDDSGVEVGRFMVEMEARPSFYAYKVE
jgi:hypothetical protein